MKRHPWAYKSCQERPRPQAAQLRPAYASAPAPAPAPAASALGSMALWLTLVVVLTCFGGLASPGPVPAFTVLRELIEELDNITQKVSAGRGVLGSRNWSWPGPRRLGLALRCLRVRKKPRGRVTGERGVRLGVPQDGWPHEGIWQSPGDRLFPWPGPACPSKRLLSHS